jgi:hypothetical protein
LTDNAHAGSEDRVHRADGHRENRPMEQVLEWIFTVAMKPFSHFAKEYFVPVSLAERPRRQRVVEK